MEKILFYLLLFSILCYTFHKLNIFKSRKECKETFKNKDNEKRRIKQDKKFTKNFNSLINKIPCDLKLLGKELNRGNVYYLKETVNNINDKYLLLTYPDLHNNNLNFINDFEDYTNFINVDLKFDNILDHLRYNIYTINDHNYTDIITILPEYKINKDYHFKSSHLEDFNIDKTDKTDGSGKKENNVNNILHTHDKKEESNDLEFIRYIGGVSYTYYFFITPLGSPIYSIHDLPKTVYILYDNHMINNKFNDKKLNIKKETDRNKIENLLKKEYLEDNTLNFIKDYINFVNINNDTDDTNDYIINFEPLYLKDIKEKKSKDKFIILGNNNYSSDIFEKLHFFNNQEYNILGFDINENIMFTKDTVDTDFLSGINAKDQKLSQASSIFNRKIDSKIQELSKYFYKDDYNTSSDEYTGKDVNFKYDMFLRDQRAIGHNRVQDLEKITKKLLHKYDLFNTIITEKNINELHENELKCDNEKDIKKHIIKANYNDIDNINIKYNIERKKLEIQNKIAQRKGYEYCKKYKNKHMFHNNIFQPFKTFLFRNVAITHKFTNDKLVYNILYLFLEKIKLHSGSNKIDLLNLNTKIPIHEGARKFYEDYGFISYIKNLDCVYTTGKESCEIDTRNRFSI